jgi:hypothetical protein
MTNKLHLKIFTAILMACVAHADDTSEEIDGGRQKILDHIEKFAEEMRSDQYSAAVEQLSDITLIPKSDRSVLIKTLSERADESEKIYGQFIDFKKMSIDEKNGQLMRVRYLETYHNNAYLWTFIAFKGKHGWRVASFKWGKLGDAWDGTQ